MSREQAVRRETFFVGGEYSGPPQARVMAGQMFVEAMIPDRVEHPLPLVLVHGAGQTAATWLTTPDGRQGWADWFSRRGWVVYVVDQPARGRSAWQPGVNGSVSTIPVHHVERLFTAPADYDDWPQGKLHTQWPGGDGKGHPGDPAFDQFYASQVAWLERDESEILMRRAGAALLDRIGPAILVVHSQAGLFGWLIADERPGSVKGIVAIEPSGPPFRDENAFRKVRDRPWGLTFTPLTYDPPCAEGDMTFEKRAGSGQPGLQDGWLQGDPPRQLKHLAGLPVLIVTGEASYHVQYDHCTVSYLRQAGVPAEHMRLWDLGVRGNGHMMMLEKNNLEIARLVEDWVASTISGRADHRP